MTAVSQKRIRDWHDKGLLPGIRWISVGSRLHRRFSEEDIETITRMNRMMQEGWTLKAAAEKAVEKSKINWTKKGARGQSVPSTPRSFKKTERKNNMTNRTNTNRGAGQIEPAISLQDLKSEYYFEPTARYAEDILRIHFVERSQKYNLASCPFHSDTDPSFYLFKKNGKVRFKCFSTKCQRIGDIFDLIQEIEGCGFIEAVKKFGKHAHVNSVKLPGGSVLKIGWEKRDPN
jgi:DNA-binding transcriptional MerR regulator